VLQVYPVGERAGESQGFILFVCLFVGFFFKGQVSVGSLHFHLILFGPELGPTTST
jgi:hypothetical protein